MRGRPDPVPPRYATARDRSYRTLGGRALQVAKAMGYDPMPWQQDLYATALEVDEDGRYRYPLVVISVQRQAGKSAIVQPVFCHRAMTVPRARIWNTAQLRQDARDLWLDLAERAQTSPFGDRLRRRDSNGQEQLTFPTLGTIRPFNALDKRSLHGKQADLVGIDEAWAFREDQGRDMLQALVPAQATRRGAQTWIYSAAGTAASTWFWPYIRDGRAGTADPSTRVAFFEYGIPEDTAGADLEDLDLYARYHPAVGHTIDRSALESARVQIKSLAEFARAYGNLWSSTADHAIDPALWERARAERPIAPGSAVALAAEVRADRAGGVIVAAGHDERGDVVVEVVDDRPGTGWIAPRLMELTERQRPVSVVVDPKSPAGAVHRALTEQRRHAVPVFDPFAASDLVNAQTELMDGLLAGTWRHRAVDDHRLVLDHAMQCAGVRTLAETTVFSRAVTEDGRSPAALIAAMLAAYGLRHPQRPTTPVSGSR